MEKETLAIVRAVRFWRLELMGIEFDVFTDNSAVSTVLRQSEPGARIQRWIHCLSEFKMAIHHRSGKSNFVADFLSRYAAESFIVSPLVVEPYSDEDFELLRRVISGDNTVRPGSLSNALSRRRF